MPRRITDACIACGSCKENCPVDCIEAGDIYVIDPEQCIDCGVCESNCPVEAIVAE
ncbi:MAG TPA: 4Fe-4S binding protein [Bacillota bacterium]|nr:4Fe-4S binding protein [Bacillota bacterium]HPF42749.1 4Fe-4S binding protein [Bacillota bacterium]HPJ85965.1 4Fe-4S binding protein [Bacillota bacterium]HPQ62014.1 4Fe-4S binding protein [Bacillota bacterium]HRX91743.1 4Fe-4S binding protein [Candidatus Izemoplasmatales bacterium]